MSRRERTLISLYTGAGGMDYGFEAAGFRTCVAVEMDADSCTTLRKNRQWPVLDRDIATVSGEELLDTAKLRRRDADLLIGGPPCQPFSKLGFWARGDTRRLEDPRAQTLDHFLRMVETALPRVLVLENVEGFGYAGKDEAMQVLLHQINRINKRCGTAYRPVSRVLRAADFGVPQIRDRVFVIADRDGSSFQFPTATHAPAEELGSRIPALVNLEHYFTAWDALFDVHPTERPENLLARGKWADLLPTIPEGQNYLFHTDRGEGKHIFGWRRRYWSFLLKLAKNQPSWTISASPGPAIGPFHWDNRRLSMRELCRLQTFPDAVRIHGTLGSIQRQVGNAVPSLVAEVLARSIREQVFGDPKFRNAPRLLPKRAVVPPPASAIPEPVPDRYLDLVGLDTAHPGTGKGRRALHWR